MPPEVRHPKRQGWLSKRDLVGELAEATRARGLRFGVYYSTGFDWSVHHLPVRELADSAGCIPRSADYVRYATQQLDELVDRYAPSVVWADVGTPRGFEVAGFKARLLDKVPDAVINDRWDPPLPGTGSPIGLKAWNALAAWVLTHGKQKPFIPGHHKAADFRTPEYCLPPDAADYAWEATRGLGAGFGHNAQETDAHRIDPDALVALYRTIRSLGGNLLLNVGPLANGTIPEAEASRVRHVGRAIAEGH